MKSFVFGLCSASILFVLVGGAAAQPPEGPPRGGFPNAPFRPGGPGRPGFGFPGGGPSPLAGLIALPEVQKELSLAAEQIKSIDALTEKLRDQMETAFREMGPPPFDAGPEEMERHFATMRDKTDAANAKFARDLEAVLNARQNSRLEQLRLQRDGALAMTQPKMAERLKLSDEQISKLRELQGDGFGPRRPDSQSAKDALAVLNDDQRAEWAKLTGPAFDFPAIGPGGPPGFGPPGFSREERKLLKEFDANTDGWLNAEERKAAANSLQTSPPRGRPEGRPGGPGGPGGFGPPQPGRGPGGGGGPGGPGGPGRFGGRRTEPSKPGIKVAVEDVDPIPDAPLYDPNVVRTLFLEFESDDWETELELFHNSDVDVPCTLTVDGKSYLHVGVHFRGMSSYGGVPRGSKRSLNLSLDLVNPKQRLYGYKTLNLLNAHEDPSFLHTVLYSEIARQFIPAPKANFVRVVINGESWGLYVNVQQFDKIFVEENFGGKGARWKVSGSPGGGGGLTYLGDKVDAYKRHYEIKSADKPEDWEAFITLCRTLNETPPDQLVGKLEPMLDIDGTLWFLALDNALINCDGYWIRASDYSICRDSAGKFHMIPHDMNEAFQPPMGPGFGGGPFGRRGSGGSDGGPMNGDAAAKNRFNLDPLIGLNDSQKPLRSKLLAVPELREKYLRYVGIIAEKSLDWDNLGPSVARYRKLIEKEVEADTRKLSSYAAFTAAVAEDEDQAGAGDSRHPSIRVFADGRRQFLIDYLARRPQK